MNDILIPNTTQTPNAIFDQLMPHLRDGEFKCLMYIVRRTYGFRKTRDRISFTQFINGIKTKQGAVLDRGTGMSRPAVSDSLGRLVDSGLVLCMASGKGNEYEINMESDLAEVVKNLNRLRKLTKSGKKSLPKSVKLFNLQKKGNPEKPSYMHPAKSPAAHKEFVDRFYRMIQNVRGVARPVITAADGANLKRVLQMGIVSPLELEQLALYFLAHYRFTKFSPSISTFLSAGVINALMDRAKNDENFWKDLDAFAAKYRVVELRKPEKSEISIKLEELKKRLFTMPATVAAAAAN